jgi:hypothetical protein
MTKKLKTQPETVAEFTGRAIRSAGEIIPPTVFVPLNLRRSRRRLVGSAIVQSPHTPDEIADEIARAAPHQFLIAVMQGQPIPQFTLTEGQGHIEVAVHYEAPSMQDRLNAAAALLTPAQRRALRDTGDVAFDAAIKNAAASHDEDQE